MHGFTYTLKRISYVIISSFFRTGGNNNLPHISENIQLLTLCRPMDFTIKLDIINSGWSIVYIEGSQVIIYIIIFLSMKKHVVFAIVYSEDSGEMLQYAAFLLGLNGLQKYLFVGFQFYKGFK